MAGPSRPLSSRWFVEQMPGTIHQLVSYEDILDRPAGAYTPPTEGHPGGHAAVFSAAPYEVAGNGYWAAFAPTWSIRAGGGALVPSQAGTATGSIPAGADQRPTTIPGRLLATGDIQFHHTGTHFVQDQVQAVEIGYRLRDMALILGADGASYYRQGIAPRNTITLHPSGMVTAEHRSTAAAPTGVVEQTVLIPEGGLPLDGALSIRWKDKDTTNPADPGGTLVLVTDAGTVEHHVPAGLAPYRTWFVEQGWTIMADSGMATAQDSEASLITWLAVRLPVSVRGWVVGAVAGPV